MISIMSRKGWSGSAANVSAEYNEIRLLLGTSDCCSGQTIPCFDLKGCENQSWIKTLTTKSGHQQIYRIG